MTLFTFRHISRLDCHHPIVWRHATADFDNFDELDEVSRQIARLLRDDGRKSTIDLARETGAAEGTVRRKLRRLLNERMIAVKAVLDPLVSGQSIAVIIGLDVERHHHAAVAERLASYEFVESVYATTGPFDLMVEVTMATVAALQEFILDELTFIEGVKDTETYLIGRVYKRHGVMRNPRVSVPGRLANKGGNP